MIDTSGVFRSKIYADERKINGRVYMGTWPNVGFYYDDTIISMDILEEANVLNDVVTSNELKLTLDNSTGVFDYLNLDNMDEILGSQPYIKTELGVVKTEGHGDYLISDFYGKVAGSLAENPHKAYRNGVTALQSPTGIAQELSQSAYNIIAVSDTSSTGGSVNLANYQMQANFNFNIISAIEAKYGAENLWLPNTTLVNKIGWLPNYLAKVEANISCYGNAKNSTTTYFVIWNKTTNSWSAPVSHSLTSLVNLNQSISANFLDYVDVNGYVNFAVYTDKSDGVTGANLYIDYIDFDITTSDFEVVEYIPTGKFIMTEFTNDITNKVITIVAHDALMLWADIAYRPTGADTIKLSDLINGLIAETQWKAQDINWDFNYMNGITVGNFSDAIDCRTALQYIGIVAQSTIWQDRYGEINIYKTSTLDAKLTYATYPSTQNSLYHYSGSRMYSIETTSAGMRYIDYDQMYEAPKISLEKSVYQINVKSYPVKGGEPVDNVFTNTTIGGNSGEMIVIDNPLVNTFALAQNIATWYFNELQYNAIYEVHWRQNPMLENLDIIIAENSFGSIKRSRIQRQELNYEGYLEGTTISRGGL